jgi:predicted PurR-regulated permease PerM
VVHAVCLAYDRAQVSSNREPRVPDAVLAPRRIARTVFVIALAGLCLWVLWRFIPALTWALVIAVATWPLRERLVRLGLPPLAAAAVLTLTLGILAILPFALFGAEIAREASAIADVVGQARRGQLEAPAWLSTLPVVGAYAVDWWHTHFTTPETGGRLFEPSRSAETLQWGREAARWVLRRIVIFGFTLLTLLFIYKEGTRLAADAERVGVRLFGAPAKRYGRYSITAVQATVNGLVFVALAEGLVLGIAYIFFGVPYAFTLAAATAVLGIVPFGAPVVLAVASLTLVATSRIAAAIVLFAAGALLFFVVDHTARPALIGGSIKLPFFWALLGVFGGLETFGIVGLFIGPAILAVALTVWREAVEHAGTERVSSA